MNFNINLNEFFQNTKFKKALKILKIIFNLKIVIYIISVIFLCYLLYVCFISNGEKFIFGNVFINKNSIDFGGFGSLLSGIFSPLAFLWLILNFRQQDKNLKIAEDQLNILTEEIINRRKVSKADFEIKPSKQKYLIEPNILYFKVEITSDCDLVDCHTDGFMDSIPFSMDNEFAHDKTSLSSTPKKFKKGEPYFLNIRFSFSANNKNDSSLDRSIEIKYLDSYGYDQVQKFKVSIFIDDEDENPYCSYNGYNNALLFIRPKIG